MSLRGGKASDYFFHAAKEGTILRFKGPAGKFLLPQKIETDLCFICTGTGIAPFRSMLHHLAEKNQNHKNIFLYFGTRHLNDVLFREEMEALQKTFPHFTYRFVLSKEDDENYRGEKGHVHQLYETEFANHRAADFYLCGWRGMIQEAELRLKAMNYLAKNIHHEMYD
jgi:ferredoxin-NADP reductase